MARTKTSARWLKEHFEDIYVQKAQSEGFRSRAVYKLQEIQTKDKLIAKGNTVVDLGAAPGGWSQVAAEWVGQQGKVIALDILAMDPIPGVKILQGDFSADEVYQQLLTDIGSKPVDVVLSDISPNLSGMKAVDQPRSMGLCECVVEFAVKVLKPEGAVVIKVFQGAGVDQFIRDFRKQFKTVRIRKPKASRERSTEVYIVGISLK